MHQLYDNISKVLICTYTENHVNMSVIRSIKKKEKRKRRSIVQKVCMNGENKRNQQFQLILHVQQAGQQGRVTNVISTHTPSLYVESE